jgi:hypothetical protein
MVLVFLNPCAIRSIVKMAKDDGFQPAFLGIRSTSVSSDYEVPDELVPRAYKVSCAMNVNLLIHTQKSSHSLTSYTHRPVLGFAECCLPSNQAKSFLLFSGARVGSFTLKSGRSVRTFYPAVTFTQNKHTIYRCEGYGRSFVQSADLLHRACTGCVLCRHPTWRSVLLM